MANIQVSIIIVNYNTKELTSDCVRSVLRNTRKAKYEIILIDNGSTDGSADNFKNDFQSKIRLLVNKRNFGFAKANNQGIKIARGKYLLLLNSDTMVESDVVSEMSMWMDKNPRVGVASCMLKNSDGSIQPTGGFFPNLVRVMSWMTIEDFPGVTKIIKPFHPKPGFYTAKREVDWVTGAFMFVRQEVFEDAGLIDEDYFMYTEDTDFCFRVKSSGWRVLYLPKWSIVHLGGKSSVKGFPIISEFQGIKKFYKKHYPGWQFPFLRFFLKLGAAIRVLVSGIIYGKEAARIYARAFKTI